MKTAIYDSPAAMDWFSTAGLGLFIHWGLYSIPARGEWHLWKNKVPLDDYNALARRFAPPPSFSPEEWVLLARRMGARYAVLTTRHHDGFCLWDTDTTDFNSAKTTAGRDFVREFVDACRNHGIRVGLYYSIMNWQFRKRPGCVPGTALWEEMVRCSHDALRELLTRYGRIDVLWYDGCSAPGVDDAEALDRLWRTKALNAMARELQPGILINDRSGQPEDFSTPEQCLAAPPRGRRWESCMTVNGSWGYTDGDRDWKSPETLVRSALHCARFGGNLLLNIGPRPDGSVPEECAAALESLGDYISAAPQAFYGARRDDWTEATHEAGVVVKTEEGYFLHDLGNGFVEGRRPSTSPRLDGAESLSPVAPGVWKAAFRAGAKPCHWLGGRHDVEIKAGSAPVLGMAADRYSPPEGKIVENVANVKVLPIPNFNYQSGSGDTGNTGGAGNIEFDFPAAGRCKVEIGFVNAEGFKDTAAFEVYCPQSSQLPIADNPVYAYRLSPVWRTVPPSSFELAGKFASPWYRDVLDSAPMHETMAQDMVALAARSRFAPLGARNALCDRADERVNFAYGAPDPATLGFGLARTVLHSDRAETILACIGQDWWSDVYLNGERLAPLDVTPVARGADGVLQWAVPSAPAFQGHKPIPFLLPLRAGGNELLIANHGGNRANWFALWTNAGVAAKGENSPAKIMI